MNARLAEAERFLGLYFAPGPQQDMAVLVLDELARLRTRLAEHERTQATGGPPPPETRGWANETTVPAPETAHDQSMAVPDRYQASNQKRSKP